MQTLSPSFRSQQFCLCKIWAEKRFTQIYRYLYGDAHSRPHSPRSFWPVAGIESSGLVQHRKSAIHGLPVKSGKSDWLRIRNEYSAHTQKIGSSQSSRSLPQARRIVGLGTRMGDALLVPMRMSTNMAAGNQQKQRSLSFATKV